MAAMNFEREFVYEERDLKVMQTAAGQVAVAMENARLFSEEQRRARYLGFLNNVSRRAISSQDSVEMLREIVAEIQRTFAFDHIGIGPSVEGDSIYNGADDDASGVVTVLEIARSIATGPPPERTVVFLLTTAEESGLLGTRHYLNHPVVPLDRTVADLQVEMVGRPDSEAGGAGRAWLTGYERSTMGERLAAEIARELSLGNVHLGVTGEDLVRETLEEVIEPFLLQEGFIARTW